MRAESASIISDFLCAAATDVEPAEVDTILEGVEFALERILQVREEAGDPVPADALHRAGQRASRIASLLYDHGAP